MRNAFMNSKISKESVLTETILNVLSTKAGTKPYGKGWSLNVSGRTHKALASQGFLN